MTQLLYHGIPQDLKGSELVPLGQLRTKYPELAAQYLRKYEGRETILERKIPLLNCLWNDVVQLLPLHPQKIFDRQKELGLIAEIPAYNYFAIDTSTLDPTSAAVYFKTAPGEAHWSVEWLSNTRIEELQDIPPATDKYYRSLRDSGQAVFNYQFIPHVLYKGVIDISNAKIISIK
ncbi:hypothetical protein I8H83_05545 [Candidatus Saccharibacteria bacterium]|nr:hypothetical protein [Candidatus Saccharibacteria bacterium]